ncbi:hypothetical protein tloyanaT_32610 [Thalassotalea loyana]|uniref:DUF1738 domain-containing protein n=1 Tax=Thalassotalea loyana TaxID=280483 RepID=A0ABQ6HFY0_9GAMM|nr:zincin-like metallopeptidase domain-containing protein [Thalassotalea loyana]GLX87008.1 hypothetical protein tloyanaT_32610 [Thalassotalea loyana]
MEQKNSKTDRKSKNTKKQNVVLSQVLDIYKSYIEKFKSGQKVAFEVPWQKKQVLGIPRNANTGRPYQATNAQLLSLIQETKGLDLPYFLNESDLKELGIIELKPDFPIAIGKKLVERYLDKSRKDGDKLKWISTKQFLSLSDKDQENYELKKAVRHFPLYHQSQFEDSLQSVDLYQKWIARFSETSLLSKLNKCKTDVERQKLFEPNILAAKNYLDIVRREQGIALTEHATQCYYAPEKDEIAMVNLDQFTGENALLAYVGVYAHELSHATGHKGRLNRNLVGNMGSKQYGFEELVAESSSLQIMKQFNLPSVLDEQSAVYIHSWLKTQHNKGNKDFLSIACKKGSEACQYIDQQYDSFKQKVENDFDINNAIRTLKFLPENAPVSLELSYSAVLIKNKANELFNLFIEQNSDVGTSGFWLEFDNYLKQEIGYTKADVEYACERTKTQLLPVHLSNKLFDINSHKLQVEQSAITPETSVESLNNNLIKKRKRTV